MQEEEQVAQERHSQLQKRRTQGVEPGQEGPSQLQAQWVVQVPSEGAGAGAGEIAEAFRAPDKEGA